MRTILIAEDNASLCRGLRQGLEKSGHSVVTAYNGKEALERIKKNDIDILIADLKMPKMDGLTLLKAVKEINPQIYVVIITAFGEVETAVTAIKAGAYDYITKPVSIDEIELVVKKIEDQQRLIEEREYLREEAEPKYDFQSLVGSTPRMREIYELIKKVAKSNSSVLIRGASGTGKELVAMAIHSESLRRDKPLIKVACGALSESLLESELFGHEKGAFTGAVARRRGRFELADKGTLFLDEIGDISLSTQVKLLRVLQENEFERVGGMRTIKVDVRLIVSTNRNLERAIQEGSFREDLYYRLNVVPIYLPSLRERKQDIPLLANYFLRKFNRETDKKTTGFHPEAVKVMTNYDWPGNIRELENAVERAVVLGESKIILSEHLPFGISTEVRKKMVVPKNGATVKDMLEDLERQELIKALEKSDWKQARAAKLLGLSRSSLRYKMKKFKCNWRRGHLSVSLPVLCRLGEKGRGSSQPMKETTTTGINSSGAVIKWPKNWKDKDCSYCLDWLFGTVCDLRECPHPGKDRNMSCLSSLELELEIKLPARSRPIKVVAQPVRLSQPEEQDNYDLGLKFTQIAEGDKEAIINFIESSLVDLIDVQQKTISRLQKRQEK